MRRRRIFKPAPSPRRWGTFAVAGIALVGAVVIATAVPGDLFGSAPRNQSWQAAAEDVRVVDGDTLRLGDRMLRLYAVDAPERGQACPQARDCGAAAAEALARLVNGRDVECRLQGRDRLGRALGVCRANGVELNASLVASGWAVADATAMPALGPLEATAREAGRGLWSGGNTPEAWRRRP